MATGNGDNDDDDDDDDDENMVGRWYNWVTCGPRERRRPPILPTPPYNQWPDPTFDPEQYHLNNTTCALSLHPGYNAIELFLKTNQPAPLMFDEAMLFCVIML